jgi:O-antigen ligase
VKNPLVGIGLGNYRFEFTNIILSKFPEATNFSEVLSYINAGFTTPKSLYIKILCECGILGFIIFSIFIFNILRKVLKAKFKLFNKNIILFFTCSLLSIMLQFDTMAYLNFWIGLAFIDSLKIKYNSI